MSEEKFNISELFSAAFGTAGQFLPKRFVLPADKQQPSSIHFDVPEVSTIEEAVELTEVGTPIIFPVTFVGKQYQYFEYNGKVANKQLADFRLPATAMCEFSRQKAETTTPLSGGVGSVIEVFGFESWDISIKGICFSEGNHPQAKTALEQKSFLYQWESLADSIKVECDLFKAKDIYNIFIKSIRFTSIAGTPGLIPFEIQCYSDEPVELNI